MRVEQRRLTSSTRNNASSSNDVLRTLLLGDIHTDHQQRQFYRPMGFQEPLVLHEVGTHFFNANTDTHTHTHTRASYLNRITYVRESAEQYLRVVLSCCRNINVACNWQKWRVTQPSKLHSNKIMVAVLHRQKSLYRRCRNVIESSLTCVFKKHCHALWVV